MYLQGVARNQSTWGLKYSHVKSTNKNNIEVTFKNLCLTLLSIGVCPQRDEAWSSLPSRRR